MTPTPRHVTPEAAADPRSDFQRFQDLTRRLLKAPAPKPKQSSKQKKR